MKQVMSLMREQLKINGLNLNWFIMKVKKIAKNVLKFILQKKVVCIFMLQMLDVKVLGEFNKKSQKKIIVNGWIFLFKTYIWSYR